MSEGPDPPWYLRWLARLLPTRDREFILGGRVAEGRPGAPRTRPLRSEPAGKRRDLECV